MKRTAIKRGTSKLKKTRLKAKGKRALSEEDELQAFRRAVLARDKWACRRCGSEASLHVHHLLPRGRGGKHEPDNGVAMCASCHHIVHHHLSPDWMDWVL
jgi:5-methylcytosine-specific restriction endonuclease McrA